MKYIKNLILLTAAFLTIMTVAGFSAKSAYAAEKVEVCHENHTIEISTSALQAHLAHGDTEGECPEVPAVPEFGLITGALAMVGSAGSFLVLKRKNG